MLIKKEDAEKHENSEKCTVWEYRMPSKLMSFGTAKINGRYPDKGSVSNTECEEIYYAISGNGVVHSEKGDFPLSSGDVYFFEKAEKYWVEGDGLLVALLNAPPWDPKQHEEHE